MHWLPIALIPSALFAVCNYLDKYLIEEYFKEQGNGALIIFSSLIGVVVLPFIVLFIGSSFLIAPLLALAMVGNGVLYVLALLPYLSALHDDEASVVVPLWQLIPVFGYLLGYLTLGESLSATQLIAGAIIVAGAFTLSLGVRPGEFHVKWKTFALMAFSSLLMALNGVLFKLFALDASYGVTLFWDSVGLIVIGVAYLVFSPSSRHSFIEVFRQNSRGVLTLNGANEVINIVAMFILNYALLLAPVTFVFLANASQPLWVLLFGVILTLLFPHVIAENLDRRTIAQKLFAILLLGIGVFLMDAAA